MKSGYICKLINLRKRGPRTDQLIWNLLMILPSDIMTNHNEGCCGKIMQQKCMQRNSQFTVIIMLRKPELKKKSLLKTPTFYHFTDDLDKAAKN